MSKQRRKPKEDRRLYVSLSCTVLASTPFHNLSDRAMKLFLRANLDWNPNRPLLLPSAQVSLDLGMERVTFAAAKRELVNVGYLKQTKDPARPGSCGAPIGRAAEFLLTSRGSRLPKSDHQTTPHAPPRAPGDRKLFGQVRLAPENLRYLLRALDGATLRTLFCIVLPHNRNKHGAIEWLPKHWSRPLKPAKRYVSEKWPRGTKTAQERLHVTARGIQDTLGVSSQTAQRVIRRLVALGLLREVVPGAGRVPTIYAPAGHALDGLRFDPIGREDGDTVQPYAWLIQGGGYVDFRPP